MKSGHRACVGVGGRGTLRDFMGVRDLPIYELESAVVAALRERGRLVVQAPTGSGKSTQVPQMLLAHGFADAGEIVVLQPRRLAARLLARRSPRKTGRCWAM